VSDSHGVSGAGWTISNHPASPHAPMPSERDDKVLGSRNNGSVITAAFKILVAVVVAGDAEVAGCEAVGVHHSSVSGGDEVGVVRAVEERGLRMEDKAVGDHGLGAHAQLFHQLRRGQHRATVCTHRAGALCAHINGAHIE